MEEKKWTWSQDDKDEDKRMKYKMKESTNQRMARLCLPAINSVNPNLVFTVEIPEEFKGSKLPTLDFLLWLEKNGVLNHSYFQKLMKTPFVIMQNSAMSDKQRSSILANELIRRLSNTNHENNDLIEQSEIIEIFTQQLKSSGYARKATRDMVVSGILGWKRKIRRRKNEGSLFYRSGKSTLAGRYRKKLTEKSTWFKRKRDEAEDDDDDGHQTQPHSPRKKQKREDNSKTRDMANIPIPMDKTKNPKNESAKAVMFV